MSDEEKPLVGDLTGLGKVADSKVANKVYDDALSPLMKQLGEFGEDVAKTGRLLLAPIQVLARGQDRFAKWMKELAEDVPEERRQEAPAHIAGPVLRNLVFMEEDNPLARLFVELLKRTIDKDRCDEAHPAFIKIIEQLSPDEAMLLWRCSRYMDSPALGVKELIIVVGEESFYSLIKHRQSDKTSKSDDWTFLSQPAQLPMYCWHLEALDLLIDPTYVTRLAGPGRFSISYQTDKTKRGYGVTNFGQLFINAVIPDELTLPTKSGE